MAELAHSTVWIDVQLDPWSALTLRVWSAHLEAAGKLEDAIRVWGGWVAGLPCEGPFDWMSWRPWEMWAWMATSQWPQFPRIPDSSRWTLPDYQWPVDRYADHVATQKLLSECLHDADLRIRYRRNPDEGEVLPPDTNHGGDRIPGRYA